MATSNQFILNGVPANAATYTIAANHTHTYLQLPTYCFEHIPDPDAFEYVEGAAVSKCIDCNTSIRVLDFPGGINLLKFRHLLQQLAADDADDELVAEYAAMRAVLQAEREAIELAESLMQPIDRLLAQRLLG